MNLLSRNSYGDDDISKEVMKLQISLLQGDNEEVQAKWEAYFLDTREEAFFKDVQARLEHAMLAIKERHLLITQVCLWW